MEKREIDEAGPDPLAQFAHLAMGLKEVARTGWLDRGVEPAAAESVADHSWSVALLAWLLAAEDAGLDRDRVLRLALIHDLAETITGDLTPYGELHGEAPDSAFLNLRHTHTPESALAKHEAEQVAIDQLAALLPDGAAGELRAIWAEYAARESPEARFVKEIDRLETWLQSRRYLEGNPDLPMDSFRLEVELELTHPALIRLRDAAVRRSPS
jgi:putative hydrolase of HD superfamily